MVRYLMTKAINTSIKENGYFETLHYKMKYHRLIKTDLGKWENGKFSWNEEIKEADEQKPEENLTTDSKESPKDLDASDDEHIVSDNGGNDTEKEVHKEINDIEVIKICENIDAGDILPPSEENSENKTENIGDDEAVTETMLDKVNNTIEHEELDETPDDDKTDNEATVCEETDDIKVIKNSESLDDSDYTLKIYKEIDSDETNEVNTIPMEISEVLNNEDSIVRVNNDKPKVNEVNIATVETDVNNEDDEDSIAKVNSDDPKIN